MSPRILRALVASVLSLVLLHLVPVASAKDGVVEINGVVQAMPASGLIGNWTIAGRAVRTDAATVIKQELGTVGVGAVVEVKGVDDGNGVTLATTIEVKQGVSTPPPGTPSGDFTGAIQSMPSGTLIGTWTIAGRTVKVLTTTVLKQELGGFAVGATVEVHGTVGAGGMVTASVIEVKAGGAPAPVPSGSALDVTGVVEALPASGLVGAWRVAGRSVIVGTTTVLNAEHGVFAVGVTVEAHGTADTNGALVATRVERVAGNGAPVPALLFWGTIESLPATPGFVGVWTVSGRNVNVSAATALRVNNGPIVVGAIVEVDGWPQADGTVEAHEIETRSSLGSLAGQGPLAVEYVNAALGHYFVTAFPAEIAVLDGGAFGGAWTRTGKSFMTHANPAIETVPVCRFFSTSFAPKSSHFYTANAAECEGLKANPDWQFEAIAFHSPLPDETGACPAGTDPVYRMYNNGQSGAPNHRFTTDLATRNDHVANRGFVSEGLGPLGIAMCAPR